jgi:acetoin utilization protein AcuB
MFIAQSMAAKVVTIRQDADICEAQQLMDRHHIRHLPVVAADDRLIGILTDRDIRSALPSSVLHRVDTQAQLPEISAYKVKDCMTPDPVTLMPTHTIQDALLLIQQKRFGALPVVDETGRLMGIISVRDLLRAFINVMGIGEPGTLLGIIVEERVGELQKIVDAVTEENISFGSVLVARTWEEGKRAVFPYLLTQNVGRVKRKLTQQGYSLIDPMQWVMERSPSHE